MLPQFLLGLVLAADLVLSDTPALNALPYPSGVQSSPVDIASVVPLPCIDGCWLVGSPYLFCFINHTYPVPVTSGPTPQINQNNCDSYFCSQTTYDALSACLNCVVANGNESPNPDLPASPLGSLDANQANQWLKNVSSRCTSLSKTLTGQSTVTASATTTGPYTTHYTAGETISPPIWTGQTQYTALSVPALFGTGSASSSGGSAASSSSAPTSAAMRLSVGGGMSAMSAVLVVMTALLLDAQ